jgi:hypothetical protein
MASIKLLAYLTQDVDVVKQLGFDTSGVLHVEHVDKAVLENTVEQETLDILYIHGITADLLASTALSLILLAPPQAP